MSNEIVEQKAKRKRNEKKIEASLYYERMNRNQRVTRVVHIMREQFYRMKTQKLCIRIICPFTVQNTHTHTPTQASPSKQL